MSFDILIGCFCLVSSQNLSAPSRQLKKAINLQVLIPGFNCFEYSSRHLKIIELNHSPLKQHPSTNSETLMTFWLYFWANCDFEGCFIHVKRQFRLLRTTSLVRLCTVLMPRVMESTNTQFSIVHSTSKVIAGALVP